MAALVGLVFGFLGSVPVAGPIAVLVLTRALKRRYHDALGVAAGGALAEAGYAYLAFVGLSALFERFPVVETAAHALAAALLVALGVAFFLNKPATTSQAPAEEAGSRAYRGALAGFVITLLNPTLLGTWSAATAMLFSAGLVAPGRAAAPAFALGAAAGIFLWFAALVGLVRACRERFTPSVVVKIVRYMGVFLVCCGVWFAVRAVRGFW
jgi:threonine/homoserine/homoserine lactone efflux protein